MYVKPNDELFNRVFAQIKISDFLARSYYKILDTVEYYNKNLPLLICFRAGEISRPNMEEEDLQQISKQIQDEFYYRASLWSGENFVAGMTEEEATAAIEKVMQEVGDQFNFDCDFEWWVDDKAEARFWSAKTALMETNSKEEHEDILKQVKEIYTRKAEEVIENS